MKEEFIIIRNSNESDNYVERIIGTRDQVREHLMKMITEDADEFRDGLEGGTKNVDEIEVTSNKVMHGFNYFVDYSIEYFAYPLKDIPMKEV
jgi:hypothetical protein